MQIDVNVDGLSHRIEVDKEPTEADVHEIAASLRQSDAYTQHEQANGLPSGTLRSLAEQESTFNPRAESGTGARGLMQFTHGTGKDYGITDDNWHDPQVQIAAGGRYMRDLLARNNGDLREALKHYYGTGAHRPGDPTPDEYATSVLARMQRDAAAQPQPQQGGLVAAPSEAQAAEAPTTTPVGTETTTSTLAERGRKMLVQGFIKPAAHVNAVLNRWGAGTITPQEFNDYYAGLGFDTASLPTAPEYQSKVGQAFEAVGSILAPTMPEMWAGGVATAGITGSHDIADGVEAAIGGVQAVRAGIGLASRAPAVANRLYEAARGMRRTAALSELGAETATAANRAATAEALAAAKDTAPSAGAQLRETLGVPEQVSTPEDAAALAGKALTAVGRHRYELLPGEDVGIHGAAARLNTRVRQLFGKAQSAAGKLAPVAADDGDVLQLQKGANELLTEKGLTETERELLERVESLGGGRVTTEPGPVSIGGRKLDPHGTPEEQALYSRLQEAAQQEEALPPVPQGYTRMYRGEGPPKAGFRPTETSGMWSTDRGIAEQYAKAKLRYVDVHPSELKEQYIPTAEGLLKGTFQLRPSVVERAKDVPTSNIREAIEASRRLAVKPNPLAPRDLPSTMRLYGALRRAVLKPQEYPNLAGRGPARNAVYQLSNQLGDLIRARTSQDPEAFRAWERATRYVLEEQAPFRSTVVKPIKGKAGLPQQALGSLLGKDSQPLERLVRNVSASQRELYQRGLGMQMVERATEADGKISATKFRTAWNALPTRSRQMIAAVQPEAAAALNDVIAGKRTWGEVAPTLNAAVEKVNAAIDALSGEQRATRQAGAAERLGRKAAGGMLGGFARYQAMRAALGLGMVATGHPGYAASAAYHGASWLLMRHPNLFISLVRSNAATPEQRRVLTAGLAAAMQPLDAANSAKPAPAGLPAGVTAAMQP